MDFFDITTLASIVPSEEGDIPVDQDSNPKTGTAGGGCVIA